MPVLCSAWRRSLLRTCAMAKHTLRVLRTFVRLIDIQNHHIWLEHSFSLRGCAAALECQRCVRNINVTNACSRNSSGHHQLNDTNLAAALPSLTEVNPTTGR